MSFLNSRKPDRTQNKLFEVTSFRLRGLRFLTGNGMFEF